MDIQELMLYVLILINQIIAYGALVYLAVKGHKDPDPSSLQKEKNKKVACEKAKRSELSTEEADKTKGKYLEYINKFEVEA